MSQSEASVYEVSREFLLSYDERTLAENILVASLYLERSTFGEADELGYGIRGFPHEMVESLPKWLED